MELYNEDAGAGIKGPDPDYNYIYEEWAGHGDPPIDFSYKIGKAAGDSEFDWKKTDKFRRGQRIWQRAKKRVLKPDARKRLQEEKKQLQERKRELERSLGYMEGLKVGNLNINGLGKVYNKDKSISYRLALSLGRNSNTIKRSIQATKDQMRRGVPVEDNIISRIARAELESEAAEAAKMGNARLQAAKAEAAKIDAELADIMDKLGMKGGKKTRKARKSRRRHTSRK